VHLQHFSRSHFTAKERDAESGLDYFGARYYGSSMGRWMSPDWSAKPEAVPYSVLDNPQSLNLYGYEGNNPLSKADKDGHCWPVCTALLGAGLGALAEAGGEYLKGEKLDPYKIGAAAIAGGVTGAIAGPIGDAAELGVAAKVGGQLLGNLVGGAVERTLNGDKVADPKAAAADLAGAGASAGVEKGLGKQLASEVITKVTSKAIDTVVDTGRRGTPDPPPPTPAPAPQPPPPPTPQPQHTN
jgi:RHS repeat-associated protein